MDTKNKDYTAFQADPETMEDIFDPFDWSDPFDEVDSQQEKVEKKEEKKEDQFFTRKDERKEDEWEGQPYQERSSPDAPAKSSVFSKPEVPKVTISQEGISDAREQKQESVFNYSNLTENLDLTHPIPKIPGIHSKEADIGSAKFIPLPSSPDSSASDETKSLPDLRDYRKMAGKEQEKPEKREGAKEQEEEGEEEKREKIEAQAESEEDSPVDLPSPEDILKEVLEEEEKRGEEVPPASPISETRSFSKKKNEVKCAAKIEKKTKKLEKAERKAREKKEKGEEGGRNVFSWISFFLLQMIVLFLFSDIYSLTYPAAAHTGLFGVGRAVVVSESMVPALNVDDIIIYQRKEQDQYKVGDVVLYEKIESNGASTLIVHRIVTAEENQVVTCGDNNGGINDPAIYREQICGVVLFKIPYLGKILRKLHTVPGFVASFGVVFVYIVIWDVIRRKKRKKHLKLITGDEKTQDLLKDVL